MSEQTKQALYAAFEAHVQDEAEHGVSMIMGDCVFIGQYTTMRNLDNDTRGYFIEYPDTMPVHAGAGLLDYWLTKLRAEISKED